MSQLDTAEFLRLIQTSVTQSLFGHPEGEGFATYSIEQAMRVLGTFDSARFIIDNLPRAQDLVTCEKVRQASAEYVLNEGLLLEFGVYSGVSISQLASLFPDRTVYGFDSFEGLPTDWTHVQREGRFSTGGKPPENSPDNVEFVVGLFSETLPTFCEDHAESVALLHIDSDLYESAVDIFDHLGSRLVPGSVIIFDEYFNFPGWQHHEHKALVEFVEKTGMTYRYLSFSSSEHSLMIQVIDNPGADKDLIA